MRVPHSCGHRDCPHCQHHESQQWLERQLRKQVPAGYFLLTFTVPAQFRPLAFAHQTLVFDLLMRCAWETVRTFSGNDRQLQGTPGATAVLQCLGQAACAVPVLLLRGGDDNCADADSVFAGTGGIGAGADSDSAEHRGHRLLQRQA